MTNRQSVLGQGDACLIQLWSKVITRPNIDNLEIGEACEYAVRGRFGGVRNRGVEGHPLDKSD